MRDNLQVTGSAGKERTISFASESLGIPDNKSVELSVHRVITPDIAQSVLGVGFDPRNTADWPRLQLLDRVGDYFDKRLHSVDVSEHQFFRGDGRRISVHEYIRLNNETQGSAIKVPTLIWPAAEVRRAVLSNAGREANIKAHKKALNFYRREKAGIHFFSGNVRREDREQFARVTIEEIYHTRALSRLSENGNITSVFEAQKPNEIESRREMQKILKDIDEKAGDRQGLRLQLRFNVYSSVSGSVPSLSDPDMGTLPELLKAEFWRSAAVPMPVSEIVPDNNFQILKEALVQDGWNVMMCEPEQHVADKIPAFEQYLTKKQSSQEFEKIIIFGDSPHGGILESNGINVLVQRTNNPRSKDTVSAIAVDKKGFVHIYDCYTKKGKPVWKKVGVIETKKVGEDHTEVTYKPRSKSNYVFPNRLYTYSPELTPHFKRKEITGKNIYHTRKAAIVIYPRNDSCGHGSVGVSLLYDSDGPRTEDRQAL